MSGRHMAMDMVIADQSAENTAYVRRLLRQKQPGFAAPRTASGSWWPPSPGSSSPIWPGRPGSPGPSPHTVADLTAALAGTSVPWTRMHDLS
jgi:hypothetical protein